MIQKLKTFRSADFFLQEFHFAVTYAIHTPEDCLEEQRFTREFWKITRVLKGHGRILVEDTPFPVHEGSVILVHPAAVTTFEILSEELEIDNVLFDLSFLGNELESLRDNFRFFDIFSDSFKQKSSFAFYLQDTNPKITSLIGEMKREYKARRTNYHIFLKAQLLELLILMQRGSEKMAHKSSQEQVADYVTYFLEKNYKHALSIDLLAEKVHLTPNHLCSLYKKVTGKNIITVLNEIRLKQALALLTQSDLKISAIALECGFNDLSYFYRAFKKKYSFNPGEYRRKFG